LGERIVDRNTGPVIVRRHRIIPPVVSGGYLVV